MKWTLRTRLAALCALGMSLLLAVGITGWLGARANARCDREGAVTALALRQLLEIDGMHDALRADVAEALGATTPAARAVARDQIADHTARVRARLDAMQSLPLEPGTRAALAEARPALERSLASAVRIADDAARGDHADAEVSSAGFRESFTTLEGRFGRLSDGLAGSSADASRRGERASARSGAASLALALLAMLALLLAARNVRLSITRPLERAIHVLDAIASGDLGARLEPGDDDETGRMAAAVNRAVESLTRTIRAIARNASAVGAASEELASVSQQLFANVHETSAQSSVVSSAAEQVNANVRLVAASAQQVGASIREVAAGAQEATAVARTAVEAAGRANETVRKLGDSSEQIEAVVRLITSIAEQTNILALNAEIEAARAGEAGQGFAVVANEVKDLARETARATGEIGQRIDVLQTDGREAVTAIGEIVAIIERIHATQTTIAAAVEQQSSAVAEITRNMGEAARGTAEIAGTIGSVARATEGTSIGARETQKAANELAMMATELQRIVSQFRQAPAGERREPLAFDAAERRAA